MVFIWLFEVFIWFSCEFKGLGAMDGQSLCKLIGFGAMASFFTCRTISHMAEAGVFYMDYITNYTVTGHVAISIAI